MPAMIDPSKPTREEIVAHNMKIAKANLASELAGKLCGALPTIPADPRNISSSPRIMFPKEVADFAIAVAETIIETYSLMPDAQGNKGGLVS